MPLTQARDCAITMSPSGPLGQRLQHFCIRWFVLALPHYTSGVLNDRGCELARTRPLFQCGQTRLEGRVALFQGLDGDHHDPGHVAAVDGGVGAYGAEAVIAEGGEELLGRVLSRSWTCNYRGAQRTGGVYSDAMTAYSIGVS